MMLYLLPLYLKLVLSLVLIHQHNGSYAGRPLDDQDGVRVFVTDKPIEEDSASVTSIGYATLKCSQEYPTFF